MGSKAGHRALARSVLGEKFRDLIGRMNDWIDETVIPKGDVLPKWHRSDGSHNMSNVLRRFLSDKPKEWYKEIFKNGLIRRIYALHILYDIAVTEPGGLVNGHAVTQEMVDICRKALEKASGLPWEKIKFLLEKGESIPIKNKEAIKEAWKIIKGFFKKGPNMKISLKIPEWSSLKDALKPGKILNAGSGAIKGAAIFSFVTSATKNGYKVCKGKIRIETALKEITKDTGAGTVAGVAGSTTGYITAVLVVSVITGTGALVTVSTIVIPVAVSCAAGYFTFKGVKNLLNKVPVLDTSNDPKPEPTLKEEVERAWNRFYDFMDFGKPLFSEV